MYVGAEAEDGVAVDDRVLEVDPRGAVLAHDDLKALVVPPVDARPDLHPRGDARSLERVHVRGAVQRHGSHLRGRRGRSVVEVQNQHRAVHAPQCRRVRLAQPRELLPEVRPPVRAPRRVGARRRVP